MIGAFYIAAGHSESSANEVHPNWFLIENGKENRNSRKLFVSQVKQFNYSQALLYTLNRNELRMSQESYCSSN